MPDELNAMTPPPFSTGRLKPNKKDDVLERMILTAKRIKTAYESSFFKMTKLSDADLALRDHIEQLCHQVEDYDKARY